MVTKRNEGFAFHVHHDVLIEYCTDYAGRVAYIKANKPTDERALRLRLLKIIPKSKLPGSVVKARKAYDEARKACVEARKACVEARKACVEARKAAMPDLLKIHAQLCKNCPWDGKTMFPKKEVKP